MKNEIVSLLDDDGTEQFDIDDVHDEVTWQCHSLKSLNLARNQLTFIPLAIHAAHSLEKLHLCGNKLTSFPVGWKCPLVSICVGRKCNFVRKFSNFFHAVILLFLLLFLARNLVVSFTY